MLEKMFKFFDLFFHDFALFDQVTTLDGFLVGLCIGLDVGLFFNGVELSLFGELHERVRVLFAWSFED